MNTDKQKEKKPAQRFIYDEDDIKHIFRLGDIGGVFDNDVEKSSKIQKKITVNKKKIDE